MHGFYSIKDLEQFSGLKAHTIRMWERRYDILQPKRTLGNYRVYSAYDLKKLLKLAFLNRRGIRVSTLARLSEAGLNKKALELGEAELDSAFAVDMLLSATIESDETAFNLQCRKLIDEFGFEHFFREFISPFFTKLGLLWQAESITSPYEHFASNLIRNKLIFEIENRDFPEPDNSKPVFLLFLPDNQWHELGLLYGYLLLKQHAYKTIYLGASVPLTDLTEYVKTIDFDCLLTSVSSALPNTDLQSYTNEFSSAFSEHRIFVSGYQYAFQDVIFPKNVTFLDSFKAFEQELKKMETL
jgi:DNA-binding transcriptional MerR regulator